jgi:tetratricopeptide (TPR) repeat protein
MTAMNRHAILAPISGLRRYARALTGDLWASEQAHLLQWLSKRLGQPRKVPNLSEQGYEAFVPQPQGATMKTNLIMKRLLLVLSLAAVCAASGAYAAGGGGGGSNAQADPVLQAANAAIAQKDWAAAQMTLQQALVSNAQNADYHNLYAYSLRKGPNPDMKLVFSHYEEALRINPKHRGAHEYIGEAYLQTGDLAKAREHLAALDKLCFFRCEEFTELKAAVAKYELAHRE